MRKIYVYLIVSFIIASVLSGCGGKRTMFEPKKKNAQGLAIMDHPDITSQSGTSLMDITEDIKYPGIKPYEGSSFEFISGDSPQKVAEWYNGKFEGSTIAKRTGKRSGNTKWLITQDRWIIDIIPYGGSGSLIRYKWDLKK